MSENVLALLRHLSSPSSPIPSLATGYTQPSTVFYSYLGYFWVYSFKTAKTLQITLLLVAITFVFFSNKRGSNGHRFWNQLGRATARVLAGITGALVGANLVAFVMCKVLGKAMSWYSNQFAALALFAPPALFGRSFFPLEKPLRSVPLTIQIGQERSSLNSCSHPFRSVPCLTPCCSCSLSEPGHSKRLERERHLCS